MPVPERRKRTNCADCGQPCRVLPTELSITRSGNRTRTTTWSSLYLCASCLAVLEDRYWPSPRSGDTALQLEQLSERECRQEFHRWEESPWNDVPAVEPWMALASGRTSFKG